MTQHCTLHLETKTETKPDGFDAIARDVYWLNVVRFYCGCFSKGELLDLADRVRELIADDVLGKSRHPALLAAMLLADWVFAQSPKAVGEVVATLSTRDSVRRLLGSSRGYRGEQDLQIPSGSGGVEICNRAFEFLEDRRTQRDLGRRLAEFISSNGSAEDVDRRWLASAQVALKGQVERWLWMGRELGSLKRVDRVAITAVVGDGVLGGDIIDSLCRAGRYDCILTSDANAESLRSCLLTAPLGWQPANSGKEPLYLLPTFLCQPSLVMERGMYGYDGYLEAIERFKEARSARNSDPGFEFDFSRQAFQVSCTIADLAGGHGLERAPSSKWEAIVEECRQLLGDWPAILFAAYQISLMPRGSRSRLKQVALFSRDRPVCDRIRIARSQAKNPKWWGEQLEQVNDPADHFLFHLTYWTLAPSDSIFAMADDLADRLDDLPVKEWSTLLSFLPLFMNTYYLERAGGVHGNQRLPRKVQSRRLAFLVGIKSPSVFGRSVFLDFFRASAEESDVRMAEFRQFWALETAMADVLSWESALSIIRLTYNQGASHALVRLLCRDGFKLPESVVSKVLTRAKNYPVVLWEMAEGIASARARKAIRAVGRVAREERWFAG